mgnify:FL=1
MITERSLDKILQNYNTAQRDYFCLLILGLEVKEAMRLANRQPETVKVWRIGDPQFTEDENFLVENRGKYINKAQEYFSNQLRAIDYGLMKLGGKINDWDTIEEGEKKWVMEAVKMLKKIHPEQSRGYDDYIMKLHNEIT